MIGLGGHVQLRLYFKVIAEKSVIKSGKNLAQVRLFSNDYDVRKKDVVSFIGNLVVSHKDCADFVEFERRPIALWCEIIGIFVQCCGVIAN